jgi:hypothetical protein
MDFIEFHSIEPMFWKREYWLVLFNLIESFTKVLIDYLKKVKYGFLNVKNSQESPIFWEFNFNLLISINLAMSSLANVIAVIFQKINMEFFELFHGIYIIEIFRFWVLFISFVCIMSHEFLLKTFSW